MVTCQLQAIEKDVMGDLQAALKSMLQDSSIPGKHRLDVCIMVPGPKTSPWFCHPMTLLAFAGYHARDDMIKWLISQGAREYKSRINCSESTYKYKKTFHENVQICRDGNAKNHRNKYGIMQARLG